MSPPVARSGHRLDAGRPLTLLIWLVLAAAVIGPVAIAATSPVLVGRDAAYLVSGIAGVTALALLLLQPLLAAGYLPGLRMMQERRWHRWLGSGIFIAVLLHVVGLYITSPQDTIDALLLVSPTLFSVYGVVGLWSLVLTAVLVAVRLRIGVRYGIWRIIHNSLAVVVVVSSVVHAWMIEGAMGHLSKVLLCIGVLLATAIVILHLRVVKPMLRNR
ncbi:ferric reductase-like transmembrane domain-containing protein [Pararhizobium sp. IMCC21322]|uniref:ferric reductase-like transmembrane domain-containing protein n=1 Tax=Pararhizobium sp. IMCC21322 TaxID=3067903 RepID=UPI002741DBDD|nr:ferric reductase-like transmembrane domain-containing protein [Pararhizobium sp. IMCC21322]